MWKFDESRIDLALESRSKSRAQLVALTGLTHGQIASWVSGEVKPGMESFIKIANALNIEPRFFFVQCGNDSNVSGSDVNE